MAGSSARMSSANNESTYWSDTSTARLPGTVEVAWERSREEDATSDVDMPKSNAGWKLRPARKQDRISLASDSNSVRILLQRNRAAASLALQVAVISSKKMRKWAPISVAVATPELWAGTRKCLSAGNILHLLILGPPPSTVNTLQKVVAMDDPDSFC